MLQRVTACQKRQVRSLLRGSFLPPNAFMGALLLFLVETDPFAVSLYQQISRGMFFQNPIYFDQHRSLSSLKRPGLSAGPLEIRSNSPGNALTPFLRNPLSEANSPPRRF